MSLAIGIALFIAMNYATLRLARAAKDEEINP